MSQRQQTPLLTEPIPTFDEFLKNSSPKEQETELETIPEFEDFIKQDTTTEEEALYAINHDNLQMVNLEDFGFDAPPAFFDDLQLMFNQISFDTVEFVTLTPEDKNTYLAKGYKEIKTD